MPAPSMTPAPSRTTTPAHAGLALTLIVGSYLMVGVDSTIVNVALPTIGTGLGAGQESLSWIVNAYLLMSGGLLLLGGRAGDLFGRRRVLITGLALFTGGSALAAVAPSVGLLIAARCLQGTGGALIPSSTLALIAVTYPEGTARARALSLYSSIAGLGGSAGLVLGGVLLQWTSWRWIFLITVPIGLAIIAAAPRYVPVTERSPGRLDLPGAVLATGGAMALVFGLVRAASDGWDDGTALGALGLAVLLLGTLVAVERKHPHPLLPLHLFADRNRVFAIVNSAVIPAAMYCVFYFLTQYLQDHERFSPLQAGLAFLPITMPMLLAVRLLPRVLRRTGPRPPMIAGAVLISVAAAWLTRLGPGSDYATGVLGPMLICGLGVGMSFLPLTLTVMSTVRADEAGAASGLMQSMQWAGSAFGLAVLTSVFLGAGGARSMIDGMDAAFTVATGFGLVALAVALFGLRTVPSRTTVSPPTAAAGSDRNAAR